MQKIRNSETATDLSEASAEQRDFIVDKTLHDLFGEGTLLQESELPDPDDDDEDDEDLDDEDEDVEDED